MPPSPGKLQLAWAWLKAHWYIPLFVVGVIIGAVFSKRVRDRGAFLDQTKAELEASSAAAEALRWKAELGAERAAAKVEAEHRAELEALDEKQKQEAEQLRKDPGALARYLVRAGSQRTGGPGSGV